MSTATTSHQIPHPCPTPTGLARLAALMVVVACLLGAGCSRGSATSSYSPTWTPPATATASASATPTLSPEQAAARATALAMEPPQPYTPQFTPEGAATAATYFLNLFPYMYATGDLEAWKNMSDDDCGFCNNAMNDAAALHDAGGWAEPWEQEITALGYLVDENDPNRYVIRFNIVSQAHTENPGDDKPSRTVEKSEGPLLIQTYWRGRDWKVEAGESE